MLDVLTYPTRNKTMKYLDMKMHAYYRIYAQHMPLKLYEIYKISHDTDPYIQIERDVSKQMRAIYNNNASFKNKMQL